MKKPTFEEVTLAFNDRLNNWEQAKEEAERYINHYESIGWIVGKTPMKKWRFSVLNWIKNIDKYNQSKQPEEITDRQFYTKAENDKRQIKRT